MGRPTKVQSATAGRRVNINRDFRPQINSLDPQVNQGPGDGYRCSCCGLRFDSQKGNFMQNRSQLYQGNNGYVTICKLCVNEMYSQYLKFFDGDDLAAMERMCQIFDMYVDEDCWNKSRKTKPGTCRFAEYSTQLSKAKKNRLTYLDTVVERLNQAETEDLAGAPKEQEDADAEAEAEAEAKRRFGVGFSETDLATLRMQYDSWVEEYGPPIDKRQEELYTTMCFQKLSLQKAIQSGTTNIGQLTAAYKSFIEAATTEIEERKRKAEESVDLSPIGVMIRDIENYCPAEFYKDKPLYDDSDSLMDYVKRFMFRPLKNLLTGSKELDREFSLSDGQT